MISLKVNGKIYSGFTTVHVYKSLSEVSNNFSFTATTSPEVFPIRNGDYAEVLLDNEHIITEGYIRRLTASYSADSHDITLEGYSALQDIVESSLPKGVKDFKGPISLQKIIEKVLDALYMNDIFVVNNAGFIEPFKATDVLAAEQDQTAYEFLQELGRKKRVFYKTGLTGDIEIIQGYDGEIDATIINEFNGNNNNVLTATYRSDRTNLFNRYKIVTSEKVVAKDILKIIKSVESTIKQEGDVDKTINKTTEDVIDQSVRNTRYKEIIAKENIEDKDMQDALKWEYNLRRSSSEEYNATIVGHKLNGQLLDTNKLIKIKDDNFGIDGKMLIKSLEYNFGLDGGSTTIISCTHRDAYKAELMANGGVAAEELGIAKLLKSIDEGLSSQ